MKKHKPDTEEAIKEAIKLWPDGICLWDDGTKAKPIILICKAGDMRSVIARIDLKALIKRRAGLVGIEKKIRKAIRPGKKR